MEETSTKNEKIHPNVVKTYSYIKDYFGNPAESETEHYTTVEIKENFLTPLEPLVTMVLGNQLKTRTKLDSSKIELLSKSVKTILQRVEKTEIAQTIINFLDENPLIKEFAGIGINSILKLFLEKITSVKKEVNSPNGQ